MTSLPLAYYAALLLCLALLAFTFLKLRRAEPGCQRWGRFYACKGCGYWVNGRCLLGWPHSGN